MKEGGNERRAEERMAPGAISAEGFLGEDARPLADIIAADEEAMRRLGLDWDEAAARLRALREAAFRGMGEPVSEGGVQVRSGDARGRLPCPFRDGAYHKDLVVARREGGPEIAYSELSIHLLEKHHFLQGRGGPYRLEPEALKALLFS
jgi:hypothetical protein